MGGRKLDTEGCQGIRFRNVTPDVFSCLKKKLQAYGIKVQPGNSGMLEGNGIVAHFSLDLCGNARGSEEISKICSFPSFPNSRQKKPIKPF